MGMPSVGGVVEIGVGRSARCRALLKRMFEKISRFSLPLANKLPLNH
jgi:hypothetical protein